ncbi:hypothetical protein GCM10009740_01030 [Terrabacter terrae]|uniref:Uncharacterized protein n=1 Tax=Terrabacter terrae TaxID=318434 RepID=A0ABN2TQU5_9MICO
MDPLRTLGRSVYLAMTFGRDEPSKWRLALGVPARPPLQRSAKRRPGPAESTLPCMGHLSRSLPQPNAGWLRLVSARHARAVASGNFVACVLGLHQEKEWGRAN